MGPLRPLNPIFIYLFKIDLSFTMVSSMKLLATTKICSDDNCVILERMAGSGDGVVK